MKWKLAALCLCLLLIGSAAGALLALATDDALLAVVIVCCVGIAPVLWLAVRFTRPLRRLLRAMEGMVASYHDGDFSLSLVINRRDELGKLLAAHNELGRTLREQRSRLAERELVLETVMQNSPVALVLVDESGHVAYANLAAWHLLNSGRSFLGQGFRALLQKNPEPLARAVADVSEDTLFSAQVGGTEETFHLSRRSFLLQQRRHELYLFKRLTRELSRQEVATWKKLIRVLSHELNNSLAPITSLAQTGAQYAKRGDTEEIVSAFERIGERAQHLHAFLVSYAVFAKLPAPRPGWVDWRELVNEIAVEYPFRLLEPLPQHPGWFDRAQVIQAIINLLKNAAESGGLAQEVELAIAQGPASCCVEVRDRGPGMSETVMSQALLPFYSTKRSGTGLGLALAREIAEAHGGCIRLSNRESKGLCASLILPLPIVERRDEGSTADNSASRSDEPGSAAAR